MKFISIVSSHRKNGNTEQLVGLVEEELRSIAESKHENIQIERISLGNAELKMCLGCRACFDKGEEFCPLKDDLLLIRDKINNAEGFIFASPVYVEDVNGIMKNWIDRMAFYCHRPGLAGKAAVILTTSGAGSTSHALNTMKFALMSWGVYIDGQYKFRAGELMKQEEMKNLYSSKIKRISDRLFYAVKGQKSLKPTFLSLLIFKVQQMCWQKEDKTNNTFDYMYWKSKGWLEPRCTYYTAVKTNWLKLKIARLAGAIAAVFFV
ncbi:MAG: flavodoxin family protein [Clostridiaceae bacterium]|nr:flavodoxin family protein [Clostridiaceae bacterium]